MRCLAFFIITFIAMGLVSCHTAYKPKSGYLCVAVNAYQPRYPINTWSKHRHIAQSYALRWCRFKHKQSITRCHIQKCIWTEAAKKSVSAHWYTCYANNQRDKGVWIGTSRQWLQALQWAYGRCFRYSDHPEQCYVNYCRLW